MTKTVEAIGASSMLVHQITRMSKFDDMLGHSLAPQVHGPWSDHLKALAMPATAFLVHDWPKPAGLIAELPMARLGASISWLTQHRQTPLVMTASFIPEVELPDDDRNPRSSSKANRSAPSAEDRCCLSARRSGGTDRDAGRNTVSSFQRVRDARNVSVTSQGSYSNASKN